MKLTENNIKHENGRYWVLDDCKFYHVMIAGLTHSKSDSTFAHNADGLSLAISRCEYLAR